MTFSGFVLVFAYLWLRVCDWPTARGKLWPVSGTEKNLKGEWWKSNDHCKQWRRHLVERAARCMALAAVRCAPVTARWRPKYRQVSAAKTHGIKHYKAYTAVLTNDHDLFLK